MNESFSGALLVRWGGWGGRFLCIGVAICFGFLALFPLGGSYCGVVWRLGVRRCGEPRTVGHVGRLTNDQGPFLFVVSCGRRYSLVRRVDQVSSAHYHCGFGKIGGISAMARDCDKRVS